VIISTNWLKQFTDINMSIDELATLIGARLVEIEEVIDLGVKYKDVIIVKVVECAKLEGSDHLNVTKIDDGGKAVDVERDEDGLVQVVCGAPNVHAGMLAAWLPPNSVVPETFDDAEPFVLGARKLRGVMSNGMLASAQELDLYEDHTGILDLDVDAAPGTGFA
jgi:phenylalanyl-tRNA synthetase beta chain